MTHGSTAPRGRRGQNQNLVRIRGRGAEDADPQPGSRDHAAVAHSDTRANASLARGMLKDKSKISRYIHLMGMHLIGMHLMCVHLMDVFLMSMHLMGVRLICVHI